VTHQPIRNVQITPRQLEILTLIGDYETNRCYSATMAEIARSARVSRTTVFEHTESLRKKGLVTESKGRARCLSLTDSGNRLLDRQRQLSDATPGADGIRLAGRVAAGQPIEAIEDLHDISLRTVFGDSDRIFALQVQGDSMIGDGIDTGDYLICSKATSAADGQMVVAIVDDENATVKRIYKEPGCVRLEASNDAYEPIRTANCRIEAKVLGVLRRFPD